MLSLGNLNGTNCRDSGGPGPNMYPAGKWRMIASLLVTLMVVFDVRAQSSPDASLFAAARTALPSSISAVEIREAMDAGLWNGSRTAVAICLPKQKVPAAWVFIRQPGGNFLSVDVSKEGLGIGRIGIAPQSAYERLELAPVAWPQGDAEMLTIIMRTRAWKAGRRYTISKPLWIRQDGTILQQ